MVPEAIVSVQSGMKLMGICFATSIMTKNGLRTKITDKHELPTKEGFDHNWVLKAI